MAFLDIPAIKTEATLARLLDKIGWRPTSSVAGERRGPCPIHASNSPRSRSFAVKGEAWYCHKCKTGGDVIDLWRALHPGPLYESIVSLVADLGTTLYCQRREGWLGKTRNGEEERL